MEKEIIITLTEEELFIIQDALFSHLLRFAHTEEVKDIGRVYCKIDDLIPEDWCWEDEE